MVGLFSTVMSEAEFLKYKYQDLMQTTFILISRFNAYNFNINIKIYHVKNNLHLLNRLLHKIKCRLMIEVCLSQLQQTFLQQS